MQYSIPSGFPQEIKKDIETATNILKQAGCTEIYLFGSFADGSYNKNSDIDIAVKGLPKSQFFKLGGRLMMELTHKFDLIDIDNENSRFAKHILRKGGLLRVA